MMNKSRINRERAKEKKKQKEKDDCNEEKRDNEGKDEKTKYIADRKCEYNDNAKYFEISFFLLAYNLIKILSFYG